MGSAPKTITLDLALFDDIIADNHAQRKVMVLGNNDTILSLGVFADELWTSSQSMRAQLGYSDTYLYPTVKVASNSIRIFKTVYEWLGRIHSMTVHTDDHFVRLHLIDTLPSYLREAESGLPENIDMATKIQILALCDDLKLIGVLKHQNKLRTEIQDFVAGKSGETITIELLKTIIDFMDPTTVYTAVNTFVSAFDVKLNSMRYVDLVDELKLLTGHPEILDNITQQLLNKMEFDQWQDLADIETSKVAKQERKRDD